MITFRMESYADVMDEIKQYYQMHHDEVKPYDKIEANGGDEESFVRMDEMGLSKTFTMREDGQLIGYAVVMVHPHLHHINHIYGIYDRIYVRPDKRGPNSKSFIEYIDSKLEEAGVHVIVQACKARKNYGSLLEHLGYELTEYTYSKCLI